MAKKTTVKKANVIKRKRDLFKKELKKKLAEMNIKKDNNFDFVINGFNILIVYYFLYIIFISGIIYYINKIKDCKCFQEKNKLVGVNITYIYIIEIIILVMSIIAFVQFIMARHYIKTIQKGGAMNNTTQKISFFISLLVNGYLIYNVVKLSEIPMDDCECDKNMLKYLLYIQSVIIAISLFFTGYMIFS